MIENKLTASFKTDQIKLITEIYANESSRILTLSEGFLDSLSLSFPLTLSLLRALFSFSNWATLATYDEED